MCKELWSSTGCREYCRGIMGVGQPRPFASKRIGARGTGLVCLCVLGAVAACRQVAGYSSDDIAKNPTTIGEMGGADGAIDGPYDAGPNGDGSVVDGAVLADASVLGDGADSSEGGAPADAKEGGGPVAPNADGSKPVVDGGGGQGGSPNPGLDSGAPTDGGTGPVDSSPATPDVVTPIADNSGFGSSCVDASTQGSALCASPSGSFQYCTGGPDNHSPGQLWFPFDAQDAGSACSVVGQGAGPCGWVAIQMPGQPAESAGGPTTLVDDDFDPCSTHRGALKAHVGFAAYDSTNNPTPTARVRVVFATSDLSAKSRVHMWVKLQTPLPTTYSHIQAYVSSTAASTSFWDTCSIGIIDGLWHELVVSVAGLSWTARVDQIGIAVYSTAAPQGTAAGTVPDPVDLYIDNVWVE